MQEWRYRKWCYWVLMTIQEELYKPTHRSLSYPIWLCRLICIYSKLLSAFMIMFFSNKEKRSNRQMNTSVVILSCRPLVLFIEYTNIILRDKTLIWHRSKIENKVRCHIEWRRKTSMCFFLYWCIYYYLCHLFGFFSDPSSLLYEI
jgi:hypothetical protein